MGEVDLSHTSRSTMNGTISQLHKGGSTNKMSDQRPVVLLNSGYQLLNYFINERLKRIVEQTNVLEPGQGRGRQGRSVDINSLRCEFGGKGKAVRRKPSRSFGQTDKVKLLSLSSVRLHHYA